ncbi:hypothetical protein BDR26DRAFT_920757 [Obelidium mucronatum]|nr:hypothetical protein BDR26DRAFT_920757 [Obelidium mucronatum]
MGSYQVIDSILLFSPKESLKYPEAHSCLLTIRETIETQFFQKPLFALILDCQHVEYVDYTGLQTLLAIKELLLYHTGFPVSIHFVNMRHHHLNQLLRVAAYTPSTSANIFAPPSVTRIQSNHFSQFPFIVLSRDSRRERMSIVSNSELCRLDCFLKPRSNTQISLFVNQPHNPQNHAGNGIVESNTEPSAASSSESLLGAFLRRVGSKRSISQGIDLSYADDGGRSSNGSAMAGCDAFEVPLEFAKGLKYFHPSVNAAVSAIALELRRK